jgi:hypothetical protein
MISLSIDHPETFRKHFSGFWCLSFYAMRWGAAIGFNSMESRQFLPSVAEEGSFLPGWSY